MEERITGQFIKAGFLKPAEHSCLEEIKVPEFSIPVPGSSQWRSNNTKPEERNLDKQRFHEGTCIP
jgi:hypothetical protein